MSLINRNEVRRLEKAAREKDKKHLVEWADRLEYQIAQDLGRKMEESYHKELGNSIDTIMLAVAYTLYYSEDNAICKDNLAGCMEDLFVSIDMFRTGEYTPQDYEEQLKAEGITLDRYDYDRIYKEHIGSMDNDLVQFIKTKPRPIVTICGNSEFKDIIQDKYIELSKKGDIVFTDVVFDDIEDYDDKEILQEVHLDKILLSNKIFVINKDKKINDIVKKEIEFAEKHNKEIEYLEE